MAAERPIKRLARNQRMLPQAGFQITQRDARPALRVQPGMEIYEDVDVLGQGFAIAICAGARHPYEVRVLEAFAYGVPVVTTPEGVEGLIAEDAVHAGIHEKDESLLDTADTARSVLARLEQRYGAFQRGRFPSCTSPI